MFQESVVGKAIANVLDGPGFVSQYTQENIVFSKTSILLQESTHPPIQAISKIFPGGRSGRGVMLTTHLHLESMLGVSGAIPVLFQYISLASGATLTVSCEL